MNCRDCLHFKACYEMATANNADEFNTITVRGDIAKGPIISNCRAAERSIGNEQNKRV